MSSTSFWSLVITVALCIWSGEASGPDDLISFAVSRGLSGIGCQVPQVLTSGLIINVFFLHKRGRAFAIYSTTFTLGIVVGAAFCGVIIQHSTWVINFWWFVACNGLAAVLVFLFMEETSFDRGNVDQPVGPRRSKSWVAGRTATFLPGTQVMSRRKRVPLVCHCLVQLIIAPPRFAMGSLRQCTTADNSQHKLLLTSLTISVCPVTILAGFYSFVNFAWFTTLTIELSIYLQEPYDPAHDSFGYGFNAQQTGLCKCPLNSIFPHHLARTVPRTCLS